MLFLGGLLGSVSFLVHVIGIGRRSACQGDGDVLSDDGDVFGLVTISSHGAESKDGKNPDHPKKNTNSTTQDKGDGSAFPATKAHKGRVNTAEEGFAFVMVVMAMVVVVVMMFMMFMMVMMVVTWGTRRFLRRILRILRLILLKLMIFVFVVLVVLVVVVVMTVVNVQFLKLYITPM